MGQRPLYAAKLDQNFSIVKSKHFNHLFFTIQKAKPANRSQLVNCTISVLRIAIWESKLRIEMPELPLLSMTLGAARKGGGCLQAVLRRSRGTEWFNISKLRLTVCSVWTLGSFFLQREWSNPATGSLERWSKPQTCQGLRDIWPMSLTKCFNFGQS